MDTDSLVKRRAVAAEAARAGPRATAGDAVGVTDLLPYIRIDG
jgi:hypothetical protein